MYGRIMHDKKGAMTYQAYGKEDQAIYSVSRGDLNAKLQRNGAIILYPHWQL